MSRFIGYQSEYSDPSLRLPSARIFFIKNEISSVIEAVRGTDYTVTLDGNEQYRDVAELESLIAAIEEDDALRSFWRNVLLIEQPLERSIATDTDISRLSQQKPVIIDESDDSLDAFARAIDNGYRGVSSKNCKGPIKSLLNAGLIWDLNRLEFGT